MFHAQNNPIKIKKKYYPVHVYFRLESAKYHILLGPPRPKDKELSEEV